MNYGLYLSANGISCSQHKMNVLANNLANVNTTAFKPSEVVMAERPREPEQMRSGFDSRQLLEQLGGGTTVGYSGPNLRQGSIERTEQKTDLALRGEGFLHLEGERGGRTNLTRDGRLRFDDQGVLQHAASGLSVLDERGRVIRLSGDEQLRFAGFGARGELLDRENLNEPLAKMALVKPETMSVKPAGENLFVTREQVLSDSTTEVIGESLESSGADPVTGMIEMIKLTREIEMNSRLIQYQDAMIGQAVTSLGRVV
jgi:flagellar basal-body rod protein FlgF